jgi:raffinose/stachyose/melibiose transport system permease protein
MSDKKIVSRLLAYKILAGAFAALWLVVAGLPFYYMLISSIKQRYEILGHGVFALPMKPTLVNFASVIRGGFWHYFVNSVVVIGLSLLILVLSSAAASYVFARLRFRLNKPLFGFVVALMAIPIHVTLIPIFMLTQRMGIYDTIWALIGPYVAFNLPISVFILTGFMHEMPKEIEEAAEIDGCDKLATFTRVIFPLSIPGMATIAIYDGVNMWNEFCFAMVLTQSSANRTLPLAVWDYQGQYSSNTALIMTVLTLSALPMIIAFIFGQDKLIRGMMAGAVKG